MLLPVTLQLWLPPSCPLYDASAPLIISLVYTFHALGFAALLLLLKASAFHGSSFAPRGTFLHVWRYFWSPLEGTTGTEWGEATVPRMHKRVPITDYPAQKVMTGMILNFGSFQPNPDLSPCCALPPKHSTPTVERHPRCCPTDTQPESRPTRARHKSRVQCDPDILAVTLGPSQLHGRRADLTGHKDI